MGCVVAAGEVAEVTLQGLLLADGTVWPHTECELQQGAILRFYYTDEPQEEPMPAPTPKPATTSATQGEAQAEPAPAPTPTPQDATTDLPVAAAVEAVAQQVAPATAPPEAVPATAESGTLVPDAAQDVTAAADAAAKLGGDYAPIVAIVLAAIAVLGGSKAWSFYKDRSAQQHELALKQLEVQAQASVPTVQPPPCQAAQTKVEAQLSEHSAKLTELERKAAAAERKAASLPDVDVGELDERVAKLEKAAKRKA
jgi:hypothetical protein